MAIGALLFGVAGAAWAGGGAYQDAMQASDWKSLQEFYRLYITGPIGQLNDMAAEIRALKQNTQGLRSMRKALKGATNAGYCKPDCVAMARAWRYLAQADDALLETRKALRGNLRILLGVQDAATKGNAAYMDAQAKYELRKLGFDMSMIVAKAFEMDPGPVFAQFLKNAGANATATTIAGDTASVGADTVKMAIDPNQLMNKKQVFATALAKYAAGKLFAGTDAKEQFVSSFVQKMAAGIWEKLNDVETWKQLKELGDSRKAKVLFTSGMVSKIALKATLEAVADAWGKALTADVDMSRKDSARSESMRLLAIAEYKAMRRLMTTGFGPGAEAKGGLAEQLAWARGRFAVARAEWCGGAAKPPHPRAAPVGDQKEVLDVTPDLARALSALRAANDVLASELAKLRKCMPKDMSKKQSPFGSSQGPLVGEIFYMPKDTFRLPDFGRLRSVGRIRTDRFDVSPREMRKGFPGVTNRFEWFALRYRGEFMVARAGTYRFRLLSDDGSKLVIDGRVVIDNDGGHPPRAKEGEISLSEGRHKLEMQYFQGPRYYVALQLFVRCSGQWRIWNTRLLGGVAGASCVETDAGR